ncbi:MULTISPECIES: hypothetical protein [Pseudothermotoga]|jgi:hypothetical protein|uniref:Uncharacterized protein n=1 Tax=Pseudothermotoga lettingae (strain ATCC BAA-301 / DSM 14385 / NBRC 107922 / TMO) TaxID=416591 RepID=A8F4P8_PSELT|nr:MULTISPECIES: hypothetical protein [Pseudothermotoga]ABV33132.1 hypothetical protein Tlet_0566 [Pseudothermotoga lettingae TMO]KUK21061.1 MAG: Uncharacterized protein XD56_1030 [Pseudothermotoga lettingae]MDI3494399.1 hypothetical protein [Pseudothermotoga sp.]MDK2884138.1 hypothetical protein [Pseudothermotoga sp.]GLI47866.1 hypothetical protein PLETTINGATMO_00350 [Pseudothermotoga lettingae TMO]
MKIANYLIMLLGIFCASIGFLMLSVYGVAVYLSPMLEEMLNLTINTSKWFLFVVLLTISSGICISYYSLAKANRDNYMIFLSFTVIANGFSFFVQLFRMVVHGIAWVGVELLGEHGDVKTVQYLSIGFLLFTLVNFVLSLSILRGERVSH